MREKPIEYFLEKIKWDNSKACLNLHKHFLDNYSDAKWSSFNHQAWTWWYMQHIKDILNLSEIIHDTTKDYHKNKFNIEDAYLVLFLHDIEKPVFYTKNKTNEVLDLLDWKTEKNKEEYVWKVRDYFLEKFNIILNDDIKHALKYIHWEWDDFSQKKRISSPLGSHCHIADTFSARISYDYKKQ